MARDKAVLADKRMRVAASGFGLQKPALKTGGAGRFGASGLARSPVKDQPVTVLGVCNVPEMNAESPADVTVSVVTRGTSPTPPAHSTFLRSRHAGQQEFTVLTVPRKREQGADVGAQTDERFLRSMPSLQKTASSSIPVPRYHRSPPGYGCSYSKAKDSAGSTSGDHSGTYVIAIISNNRRNNGFVTFRCRVQVKNRTRAFPTRRATVRVDRTARTRPGYRNPTGPDTTGVRKTAERDPQGPVGRRRFPARRKRNLRPAENPRSPNWSPSEASLRSLQAWPSFPKRPRCCCSSVRRKRPSVPIGFGAIMKTVTENRRSAARTGS